jgi:hypothetical protein
MRKRTEGCRCGRGVKRPGQQTCRVCHAEESKRFRSVRVYVKREGA